MDASQEDPSILCLFRKAIASHLSSIVQKPCELLLPLIQQNTGHRKSSHSVFYVVIKRLGNVVGNDTIAGRDLESACQRCLVLSPETREYIAGVRMTRDMLLFDPVPLRLIQLTLKNIVERASDKDAKQDLETTKEDSAETSTSVEAPRRSVKRGRSTDRVILVNGSGFQPDEDAYCSLRRTVLTGFVARMLSDSSQDPVKVIMEYSRTDMPPSVKGLYRGLELFNGSELIETSDYEELLATFKGAIQTNKGLEVQITDGTCIVDMTSQKLGKAKVFSAVSSDGLTVEHPTLVAQTVLSLVSHFSVQECQRYIWLVPDSKRQFAEQVLFLAQAVFHDVDVNSERIDQGAKEAQGNRKKTMSRSWREQIDVVYFGSASGEDLWKADSQLGQGLSGVVEFTNLRMKEIITKNRGNPGRGTEYGGADLEEEDLDGNGDDEPVLDEQELTRMAALLSTSALTVACIGCKRIRKLTVDMTRILDGKGHSGVFLQYVHSRLCGIERKSKTRLNPEADLSVIQPYPEALNLAIVLAEWDELVETLRDSLDPYALVPYLFHLATEVGQANHVLRVKDMEPAVAEARWLLFWGAKRVLEQGLHLLGMECVGRM
ncbi:hypothetical protein B0O80DRAFT_493550 [Mortierella sp. GBAus27b]|nr:Arginyl-tRNA synthetase [Mortierella sp. GBA43]KAI8362575.1 hypothetical protein B0O80DRAFT_493550 [Mortierella sp. GBAus27b]